MDDTQTKTIDRLLVKMDNVQTQLAVNGERQIQTAKDIIHINENLEKNHHRLRLANEKMEQNFNKSLDLIKERISKIEAYSKSPSIIGQFITRNKVWILAGMVALIGAVGEAGRILYKMPPPH